MAFHQQRNWKTACTSTIALSFPFPFPVVCPPLPPSTHAPTAKADTYCLFSREKVLTHSLKASLSYCVGTVAQHKVPLGAKWTGTSPPQSALSQTPTWPNQRHRFLLLCEHKILCTTEHGVISISTGTQNSWIHFFRSWQVSIWHINHSEGWN